jgi:predicted ATPase/class 3 adenylate cyclase
MGVNELAASLPSDGIIGPMRDLPSGTVTFLFTDIEGSTRLLHELGPDGYAEALAEHRRIVRESIADHDGVEVDTQGDAFFVAFPGAVAAIAAAQQAQSRLEVGPIRVRMGLHTGEPTLTDEGYVGVDVHAGARIAAAAHGDQVVLSRRTKELAERQFAFSDLGEHRLKDLDRPVWIFQLGEQRFPPLKTLSNTNLPATVSSFVGRESELKKALGTLERTRLLTVVGPGGAGKTRFAMELASSCVPLFPHGVFWVALAAIRDPMLVERAIGEVIGSSNGPASHIGHKQMLLVLDNFEQIVDAAPALTDMLSSCPKLSVVVTSRETLRLDGELEFPLPPLPEDEGVALFRARAAAESSATQDLASLVRRLDGLPLAIELAAARSKLFTIPQLIEALGRRLDVFKGGRGADPRQQTLRTTIQWSYDLLTPDERTTFARLAVFSGGFTLDAAEQIAEVDPDTLQSLLDKSMIRRTDELLEMLETIREFGLEQFETDSDAEEIRRRHAEYYTAIAEASDVPSDVVESHLRRLESEWGNIRAALGWAIGGGDAAIGLRLAGSLWRFWWNHGAVNEASRWYEAALAAGAHEADDLRARAVYGAANVALSRNDPDAAIPLLEQALPVFRRTGDSLRIWRVLDDLGIAWQEAGDLARSRRFFEEALEASEALPDKRFWSTVRSNLADLAILEGRHAEALVILDDLVDRSRAQGHMRVLAGALGNRALVAFVRGDMEAARADVRESIIDHLAVFEVRDKAHTLALAAGIIARRGNPETALRALAAYAALHDESGLVLGPNERAIYDETLQRLRAEMPPDEYQARWSEGYRIEMDAILDDVLTALE